MFRSIIATKKRIGRASMHIQALPMRWGIGDNYCYIVTDDATKESTLVDPAAPDEVLPTVKRLELEGKLKLTSITNTHHHYDHSDGNAAFHKLYPQLPVYAGKDSPLVSVTPQDGSVHKIGSNIEVRAIHTPCHTLDSICWFATDTKTGERAVFTGDTLFNAGCGRFFEGGANEMQPSLDKLAQLPKDTKVWPGHEYTRSNVKFAKTVLANQALAKLDQYASSHEKTTGVFTIGDELEHNPFMRTHDVELQKQLHVTGAVATMSKLRSMKDSFK